MRSVEPELQVQLVRMRGRDLTKAEPCRHCLEAIVPGDGSFVAIRLATNETFRFHVECYERFVGGLSTFGELILRSVAPEHVH